MGDLIFEEFVGDNLHAVVADKREDFVADVARLDVGFDAFDGVEDRCRALVDVAVCLGSDVDLLFGEIAALAHDNGVDAIVRGGIVGDDDKGRNV